MDLSFSVHYRVLQQGETNHKDPVARALAAIILMKREVEFVNDDTSGLING